MTPEELQAKVLAGLQAAKDTISGTSTPPPSPPPPIPTIPSISTVSIPTDPNQGESYILQINITGEVDSLTIDGLKLNHAMQTHTIQATGPGGSAVSVIRVPPTIPTDPTNPTAVTYDSTHVHEGEILTLSPGTEYLRDDLPITDPEHADGGLVIHGHLNATRTDTDPPTLLTSKNINDRSKRGHLMIHGTANLVGIEVRDMGRTRIEMLDPTNNPIARYPIHFHEITHDKISKVERCTVHNTVVGYRHGIVIHGKNKGLTVQNNFVHHVSGSGIYLEDGTEEASIIGNTIEDIRGYAGDYTGTPERADTRQNNPGDAGHSGNGIYCRGPLAVVRNNIVRRCPIGYLLFFFWSPTRGTPLVEFSNNIAEDCFDGLQTWSIGGHYPPFDPEPSGPSIIRNFTARRCVRGYFPYEGRSLVVESCLFEDCRDFGFDPGDYQQTNLVVRNCIFKNCTASPSTMNMAPDHMGVFEGCIFDGPKAGLLIQTPYYNNDARSVVARKTVLRNCQFINGATIRYNELLGGNRNYLVSDKLEVDGRRVYFSNQDANSILPQTIEQPIGFFQVVGCPDANLTNQQALAQYGICRANAITPSGAVQVPWIIRGRIL